MEACLDGEIPVVHRGDNEGVANRALRLCDAEELGRNHKPLLCANESRSGSEDACLVRKLQCGQCRESPVCRSGCSTC